MAHDRPLKGSENQIYAGCGSPAHPINNLPGFVNVPRQQHILVVDNHPIVRRGLRELIGAEPDLCLCAETDNAPDALASVDHHQPDLALVNLPQTAMNGLKLIKQIRSLHPPTRVLVFSLHSELLYARRVLRAGASGYLVKSATDEEILRAIRRILAGGMHFSKRVTKRLLTELSDGSPQPLEALSNRELEVFQLIGRGYAPRHIADALAMSVKTVETHRARLKQKLGLESASMLRKYAVQWYKSSTYA